MFWLFPTNISSSLYRSVTKEVKKPNNVRDFNNTISGIYHSDQMLFYYHGLRNSVRWYTEIWFHFMKMLMHNSFYLFKQAKTQKKINLIDFCADVLIVYLILTKCNRWNETLGTMVIIQNSYQQQKRKKLTLSCKRFRKSQHHETKHRCPLCKENLPHSVAPCFKLFCNGS